MILIDPEQRGPRGDAPEIAGAPRRVQTPIRSLLQGPVASFKKFAETESASGVAVLAAAVLAVVWANSQWLDSYDALWHTPLTLAVGAWSLEIPLREFVNDGLMAVFFFLVGLEIKREVLGGELAAARTASLPLVAAIGGMIVPALLYRSLTGEGPAAVGWGIPMATDIAFALAVLSLLGNRVPTSAKIFLTALAIIDDIGAVLVIALFYSHDLNWWALSLAICTFTVAVRLNRTGVRRLWPYAVIGLTLWFLVAASGVHTTVAGVLMAMAIPAAPKLEEVQFIDASHDALVEFESSAPLADRSVAAVLSNDKRHDALGALRRLGKQARSPLVELERRLHGPVAFCILPLFALANAGVSFDLSVLDRALANPVLVGAASGLVLGKPIGIVGFSWISVRAGLATLPPGLDWRGLVGLGALGGIGFTMSLFIAALAFGEGLDLEAAKIGILLASAISGFGGWLILANSLGRPPGSTGSGP